MKKYRNNGFTLLELMIVIAIIGIIAAIAIPNYSQYVLRSHRVEARNILQTIAQKIEQNYKITRSYNALAADIGGSRILSNNTLSSWGLNVSPVGAATPRYQIEIIAVNAAGYTLRASAVGPQVGDTRCANFFLDQSGAKSATARGDNNPPNSRSDVSRECWSK